MLQLYYGTGLRDIELVSAHSSAVWGLLKGNVVRYLRQKGEKVAAQILEDTQFELWHGTNRAKDLFKLLYLNTDIESYLKFEAGQRTGAAKNYKAIAEAMSELNRPI